MSLPKKLAVTSILIAVAFGLLDLFFRFLVPSYFGIGWENSILMMGLFVIGSILLLAAVVVFHFIWRDHQS